MPGLKARLELSHIAARPPIPQPGPRRGPPCVPDRCKERACAARGPRVPGSGVPSPPQHGRRAAAMRRRRAALLQLMEVGFNHYRGTTSRLGSYRCLARLRGWIAARAGSGK